MSLCATNAGLTALQLEAQKICKQQGALVDALNEENRPSCGYGRSIESW